MIGGGAAGLIACQELLKAGHRATVLEQSDWIGGVWRYSDEVEDDPLGRGQHLVHGSMYAGHRTNLPRELMGINEVDAGGNCLAASCARVSQVVPLTQLT